MNFIQTTTYDNRQIGLGGTDMSKRHQTNKTNKHCAQQRSKQKNEGCKLPVTSNGFWMKLRKILNYNRSMALIAIISLILTIVALIPKDSDDSIAIENYEKGIVYLENDHLQDAEKCFEATYNKNRYLLDIKYYYAYTEFLLENFEQSYKILEENQNTLNEDELAFYAAYELSNQNNLKSQKYINKIQEPENLKVASFIQYVLTSVELGFSNDYNTGINAVYLNSVLIDTKINEMQRLPNEGKTLYENEMDDIDEESIKRLVERITTRANDDVLALNRCKLCMYTLFTLYSIQYERKEMPIYIFPDAAESFDYLSNPYISMNFLTALFLYTFEVKIAPHFPEEIQDAYKIITKKYDELLSLEEETGIDLINEEDRELFETCKILTKDFSENRFNPKNYEIDISYSGKIYKDYEIDNVLNLWSESFLGN